VGRPNSETALTLFRGEDKLGLMRKVCTLLSDDVEVLELSVEFSSVPPPSPSQGLFIFSLWLWLWLWLRLIHYDPFESALKRNVLKKKEREGERDKNKERKGSIPASIRQ